MVKKVAVITFDQSSTAYEAFSKIKNSQGAAYTIKQFAVVEKNEAGTRFTIKDYLDLETQNKVFTDGFIGMIIGILGGPLGILFGWIIGDLVGMGRSAASQKKTRTIFDEISDRIQAGQTGLLIYFEEGDEELLDTIVKTQLHGEITRFDYQEVKEQVEEMKKEHDKAKKELNA